MTAINTLLLRKDARMKSTIKFTLIVVIAVAIVANAAKGIYKSLADREVAHVSDRLIADAKSFTSPTTTLADAKGWLEKNGFEVYFDPGMEYSTQPVFLVIGGKRKLRDATWLLDEAWEDITFRFDAVKNSETWKPAMTRSTHTRRGKMPALFATDCRWPPADWKLQSSQKRLSEPIDRR
jgi:hypothetical protein